MATIMSMQAKLIISLVAFQAVNRQALAMPSHQMMKFSPLHCNENIMDQTCTAWSIYFGGSDTFSDKVVIPCGDCVTLDPLSDEYQSYVEKKLVFNDGISIAGRLLIPNVGDPGATRLKIITKSVEVEGVLSIYENTVLAVVSNRKVPAAEDGSATLEIQLFGAEEGNRSFIPQNQNSHMCSEVGCDIGMLPFVVAGGSLDIHAMPKISTDSGEQVDCPTWTDLLKVVKGGPPCPQSYPLSPLLPQDCSELNVISFFSNSDWLSVWDAGDSIPTAGIDLRDNSFQLSGRTKSNQGPRVGMYPGLAGNSCQKLQAAVPYLLHVKIKVTAIEGYGPSSCETQGKCLYLQLQKVGRYNKSSFRTISLSKHWPKTTDGEYFDFRAVVDITKAELDDVNNYNGELYLKFLGVPAPGYDVNIQYLNLSIAAPELFPDPSNVCQNLLSNRDFSSGQHYPWKPRSGGSLLIKEENDNNYLRHAGRTPVYPGIEQTLNTGCLVKDLIYEFSMKARLDTDSGGSIIVKLVITNPSGSIRYRDLLRPPKQHASSGWVTHTKTFTVTEELATAIDVKLITMVGESVAAAVDYDDIKIEFKEGLGQEILVDSPLVAKCWGPGEVLITPSTNQYTDSKVVHVVDVSIRIQDGKEVGVIKFEGEVGFHPHFENADPRTRAEVALLSRNMLLTAVADPGNPLHGGHLIVLHTPDVVQHLEGVHVKGMGQQGKVGRYPIHIHISHNVAGSIVKANTITDSNQRCIVIHGSHEAVIESNVAYNTKGHCFMTEDGNEFGNIFRKNLGALTVPVETANLLSSADSDHKPSTFWMPTPRNSLVGNVAAGSAGSSGFWFEVEGFFRGASKNAPEVLDGTLPVPSRQDLYPYVFESNKAHSNAGSGMKTYPSGGWKPPTEAVFSNFISYRNRGVGAFSHNGLNQSYIGGYFADNQYVGIDIDRSYQGRIENVTIAGYSEEYEALVMSSSNLGHINDQSSCGYNNKVQRGIQIHAAKSGGANSGYKISGVRFQRFGSITGCWDSAAIDVDSREDSGYFDPRTSFKSINYENVDDASRINVCDAELNNIDYVNFETDSGYVVSDNPLWTTLPTGCTPLASGLSCASFCPVMCIRSLKVSVPSAGVPTNTLLRVIDTITDRSIEVPGEWDSKMMTDPEWYMLTAFYRLYLPGDGEYVMSFVSAESGSPLWPTFVDTIYEDTDPDGCGGEQLQYSYDDSGDPAQCDQLIKNGAETWLHSGGGVFNETDSNGWFLENKDRDSYANGLVRYVDTRCFEAGAQYRFTAKVMITDENGNSLDCDPNDRKCPVFRMNSSGGPPGTSTRYNEFFGFSVWTSTEWNGVDVTIIISEEEAEKNKSMLHIYGSPDAWSLRLKDVSMTRV